MVIRSTFVICTLAALTSLVCACYLWIWVSTHDERTSYTFGEMVKLFDGGVDEYWDFNGTASVWLLSFLFGGLLISFCILMYNIRKYYKEKMSVEMRWLGVLFAVFCVSYGLRMAYQYELGNFKDWVPNMVTRWHFVNTMPIIFDIFSIGAIVIMHHLNFHPKKNKGRSYSDEIYDILPEDVDNLDYLPASDENGSENLE